jgi:hypothetical protein
MENFGNKPNIGKKKNLACPSFGNQIYHSIFFFASYTLRKTNLVQASYSPESIIGGVFVIAGLYLVTSSRYNEAKRALTDGYLDPLLLGHPRTHKTQESCFGSSINP